MVNFCRLEGGTVDLHHVTYIPTDQRAVVPGTVWLRLSRLKVLVPSTQISWAPPEDASLIRVTMRYQRLAETPDLKMWLPPDELWVQGLFPWIHNTRHGPSGFSGENCCHVLFLSWKTQLEGRRQACPK